MFYVVKKHISVIINKAPYPEKPLLSVEAVWEERHLVSDLEVAAGAFSAVRRGCHSRCVGGHGSHAGDRAAWSCLRVSVLLGRWLSSVKAIPTVTWWFSQRERHIKGG